MSAPTGAHELRPTLPLETTERQATIWSSVNIHLDKIIDDNWNPRTDYGEVDGSFAALVESIRQRGMLQPPLVRPMNGKVECQYHIIAGHRRIAAARALGWKTVLCTPIEDAEGQPADYTDSERLIDALVENLQRKNLNCIEVAEGIARLEKLGKKQSDIAGWIGRDQGRVSKTVRLLELPVGVRTLLRDGGLSQSHGEELLPLLAESFLPGEIETLAYDAAEMSLTKSGLRNVVQEKIKRSQPVQKSIDDYAPAHNSHVPLAQLVNSEEDEFDARIARTLAATKGMDKEPAPDPKDTNGLTRKESDAQFVAAMAPDPDVNPLVDRTAKQSGLGDGFSCSSAVAYQEWLKGAGLDESAAIVLLNRIVGPNGLKDAKKPGMWVRLEPDTAQKLMELCDWHLQEHGEGMLVEQMLYMVVEVYHSLKLERRAEAQAATEALGAGFPVFEEPA